MTMTDTDSSATALCADENMARIVRNDDKERSQCERMATAM